MKAINTNAAGEVCKFCTLLPPKVAYVALPLTTANERDGEQLQNHYRNANEPPRLSRRCGSWRLEDPDAEGIGQLQQMCDLVGRWQCGVFLD